MKKIVFVFLMVLSFTKAQYGTIDTSFGNGGYVEILREDIPYPWNYNLAVKAITMDSDNNIYVVFYFTDYDQTTDTYMVKLLPDGSRDLTYGESGFIQIGVDNALSSIKYSSALDKMVLVETFSGGTPHDPYSYMSARVLNLDGSLYKYYTPPTYRSIGNDVVCDEEGNFIMVGTTNMYASAIAFRYLTNLDQPDYDFGTEVDGGLYLNIPGNTINSSNSIAYDQNNRIIIGGISGITVRYGTVFRVLENGDLDNSFNQSGYLSFPPQANKVFLSPQVSTTSDNKTLIAMSEIKYPSNVRDNFVMRKFNEDGTFDVSFGNNGVQYYKHSAESKDYLVNYYVLNNDKIIAFGGTQYNGVNQHYLLGLSENGDIDSSFGVNGWALSDYLKTPSTSGIHMNGIILAGNGGGQSKDIRLMKYNIGGLMNTNEISNDQNNVQIYPNPASTSFTIVGNETPIQEIKITDANGKIIKRMHQPITQSNIAVKDLAAGVYFVEIYVENGKIVKKLIIR